MGTQAVLTVQGGTLTEAQLPEAVAPDFPLAIISTQLCGPDHSVRRCCCFQSPFKLAQQEVPL